MRRKWNGGLLNLELPEFGFDIQNYSVYFITHFSLLFTSKPGKSGGPDPCGKCHLLLVAFFVWWSGPRGGWFWNTDLFHSLLFFFRKFRVPKEGAEA